MEVNLRRLNSGSLVMVLCLGIDMSGCRSALVREEAVAPERPLPSSYALPISGASDFVSIADDPVRARQLAAHVEMLAQEISVTAGFFMKLERALRGLGGDAAHAPLSPEPTLVTASSMLSVLTMPPLPHEQFGAWSTALAARGFDPTPSILAAVSASVGSELAATVATMTQEPENPTPAVPPATKREPRVMPVKPRAQPGSPLQPMPIAGKEGTKPASQSAKTAPEVVFPANHASDGRQWLGFGMATPLPDVLPSDHGVRRPRMAGGGDLKVMVPQILGAPSVPIERTATDRPMILMADARHEIGVPGQLSPLPVSPIAVVSGPLPVASGEGRAEAHARLEFLPQPSLQARPSSANPAAEMPPGGAYAVSRPRAALASLLEFDVAQFAPNRGLELGVNLARALVDTAAPQEHATKDDELAQVAAQNQWQRDELDAIYLDMIDIAQVDDPEATPAENHSYALCMTRALAERGSFESLQRDREAIFDQLERDGTRGACTAVALDTGSDHPDARIFDGKWTKRQRQWMAIRCAQDAVQLYGTNLETERKACECLHAQLAPRMSLAELLRLSERSFAELVESDAQLSACLGS